MKLTNSTDWPDHMLRRMTAWCCKEIGLPVRFVKGAQFRQRHCHRFSGRASHWSTGGKIVVSVAPDSFYPWTDHGQSPGIMGIVRTLNDRVECLVNVTAHEIRHLYAEIDGERTRRRRSVGSSERLTERAAQTVLAKFRENREALLADWSRPIARAVKVKANPVECRAAKAQAMLNNWTRKLKLAQTKVRKYRRTAQYYERKAACAGKGVTDVS